jgi:hypothetical protein
MNLVAQRLFDLLTTPAVAQGKGNRSFGALLADNVPIEFGHDLAGHHGTGLHAHASTSMV